jgi:hypothetical protein
MTSGCGGEPAAEAPQLVNLLNPDRVLAAGRPQRLPFGVVDDGTLELSDDIEVPVSILQGTAVVERLAVRPRVVAHEHAPGVDPDHEHANLLRYFALRAELPEPGIYDVQVELGGRTATLPVQAFDPAQVTVPLAGDRLPAVDTPTASRPTGIDPLCTRAPEPCPLHELSVADVSGSGRPLALLVATPALCQTAYCGPVLETLLAAAPRYPSIAMVHLEVYANAADVAGNYNDPALRWAQPVLDLGLSYEPSLFLVDGTGRVADRLDNIFDDGELAAGLDTIA